MTLQESVLPLWCRADCFIRGRSCAYGIRPGAEWGLVAGKI